MDITAESYVRSCVIALSGSILQRERVYLDLNYWISLRDVVLGRRSDPELMAMLVALRTSVKEKRRICPISESTFLELLKQNDEETRLATAELIDELSEGVSLSPLPERMATEVAHFFYATLGHDVLPLNQIIWSKLGYILGISHPFTEGLDEAEQCVLQKAFFDHMWDTSLVSVVSVLGFDATQKAEFAVIAQNLNNLNARHAVSMKSFKKVYEDEFIGGLELAAETGRQVLERMWIESGAQSGVPTDVERRDSQQHTFRLLRAIFNEKRDVIVKALPTLHIGALCQAAVRWDQSRKLTGNDLFDFHHAQAALPYCDVFLTERPLHILLQQKHVDIEKHFSCRIISSQEEAATYLGGSGSQAAEQRA